MKVYTRLCFIFVICFRAESSKIRQRRCGFVWPSIWCRFVVLLWSVCHENDLKYREKRIPEISNWWFSLKLRTTDVVSFQITVPSSMPPFPPPPITPVSIHLLLMKITAQNKQNIKDYIQNSRSTQHSVIFFILRINFSYLSLSLSRGF